MLAVVFSMQPVGQILFSVEGLVVLLKVGRNLKTEVDREVQAVICGQCLEMIIAVGAINSSPGISTSKSLISSIYIGRG